VANYLIFYNVFAMTKALHKPKREGGHLCAEAQGRLSPYLAKHVNRFGIYHLEIDRQPQPGLDKAMSSVRQSLSGTIREF
jgi:hypothetical protein